jgi:hypothetical protein
MENSSKGYWNDIISAIIFPMPTLIENDRATINLLVQTDKRPLSTGVILGDSVALIM